MVDIIIKRRPYYYLPYCSTICREVTRSRDYKFFFQEVITNVFINQWNSIFFVTKKTTPCWFPPCPTPCRRFITTSEWIDDEWGHGWHFNSLQTPTWFNYNIVMSIMFLAPSSVRIDTVNRREIIRTWWTPRLIYLLTYLLN